ncbi:hypothetical protein BLD44_012025 [Mastigocladus laminosus UU774]|nr:hypothetical protein BLD44_012025 [Mastigocladus laminosus UU774]
MGIGDRGKGKGDRGSGIGDRGSGIGDYSLPCLPCLPTPPHSLVFPCSQLKFLKSLNDVK